MYLYHQREKTAWLMDNVKMPVVINQKEIRYSHLWFQQQDQILKSSLKTICSLNYLNINHAWICWANKWGVQFLWMINIKTKMRAFQQQQLTLVKFTGNISVDFKLQRKRTWRMHVPLHNNIMSLPEFMLMVTLTWLFKIQLLEYVYFVL